jgi:magnesium-transporting ATPase (P-type)
VLLSQGLRTLVLGTKIISEEEYREWDRQYQVAASSFEQRDEKVEALGKQIEEGLELVGVTAIEDKLQVGHWAQASLALAKPSPIGRCCQPRCHTARSGGAFL